jgi:hypothetical protein
MAGRPRNRKPRSVPAGGGGPAPRPSRGGDGERPIVTPDRRYLIVRGRLWRAADPSLKARERERLTSELMAARRAVGEAMRGADEAALTRARRAVHEAKVALGERGPVWWRDGAPDFDRHLVHNSPYAGWYAGAVERAEMRRREPRRQRARRRR